MHLLEVEITTRCNFDCLHCYNRNRKVADLPVDEILSLMEFAQKNNVQSFVFSGGEASLHPEFDLLANSILRINPQIRTVLQTNGAASKKPFSLLKAFKAIHISYEPDNSEVRRVASKELVKFATSLVEQGIYAYLFATIHQGNISFIDDMVRVANDAGLDIGFNLCIPSHENPELALSSSQAMEVTKKLYGLYLQNKVLRFTSPLASILKGVKSEKYIGNRGGCTAGIAACSVTVDGDVIPCPFFRSVTAGNIHKCSLEKIWLESEVFKLLRNRGLYDDPCGSCEFISYCGGCRRRALDISGKLTGPDHGCFLKLLS